MSSNDQVQVHWHEHAVSREEREKRNGQSGCVVWFTGLSACGKSTVANLLDHRLHSMGLHSFVLDGDNIRHGLNAGPGMLKDRHGEDFAKRFGLGFSAIAFEPRCPRATSSKSSSMPQSRSAKHETLRDSTKRRGLGSLRALRELMIPTSRP